MSDKTNRLLAAIGELGVPILSWAIITLPLWLSPFHPAVVAYFIIAFDLYFLYKSVLTSYHSAISYRRIIQYRDVNFAAAIREHPDLDKVLHGIIIPNYKEPLDKLALTIEQIVESDYPSKNKVLILAFEKRETEAVEKARILKERFGNGFLAIVESYHELTAGEVPGKASNQTAAARIFSDYCETRGWEDRNVIVTVADADSMLPPNYLSHLTHDFLKDPERQYHFYWAPVLLYNNFWKLPFFVRIQATLSSIIRISLLSQKDRLIHVSTYSTNLWLLHQTNYWDVDIIPEDWHIYFQAYFKLGDKVRTLPLYTLINGDAVYSGGLMKTFVNRYEQEKRWAWGVTDIGYAWHNIFRSPHIPLRPKLKKLLYLVETHLFWPTSFFILTISASIPPLVNPVFKRTVLGFLLPQLSGLILTTASILLLLYVYLDVKIRQNLNIKTKMSYVPLLFVQWYLLPIVSFVLSSLPALEAHTRILLGKKITYKVTEKV